MGEARRKLLAAQAVNGAPVLEPRGLAPANVTRQIDLRAGVSKDATKVVIQCGDILMHLEPEDAEEVGRGLLNCAQAVRMLQAQKAGKIVLA